MVCITVLSPGLFSNRQCSSSWLHFFLIFVMLVLLQRIPGKLEQVSPQHFTQKHVLSCPDSTMEWGVSSPGDLLSALRNFREHFQPH